MNESPVPAAPPIPGLSEAIAQREAEKPQATPTAVKWMLAGVLGAVAGLELTAQQHPDPTVQLACRIAAVALGTFAGVASPGLSRFRK